VTKENSTRELSWLTVYGLERIMTDPNLSQSGNRKRFSLSVYTVNSFDVNASELTIRDVGNASISEDTIDLKLNLLTEGQKDLSNIPLIGYVLVGDEKVPSIKLEVTEKLSDPDIQNSAFEEIVTLPFDIGFRALSLLFRWMDNLCSDEDTNTQDNSKNQ